MCLPMRSIILMQIAMADRVAQAEEQSNELPPYYWEMVEMFGNGNGDGAAPRRPVTHQRQASQ
ncbi:hypothetical protein HJFPF1_05115 [Paramyrothecium foliicola]|nr:hypothetical protein HJFPF1_05115 [Paramyrothecium foliicola]